MKVLQSVLRPPVFVDEDKTRTAALVNTVLVACSSGSILFFVVAGLFIPDEADRIIYALVAMPLLVGLLVIVRWGYVRFASIVLVLLLWVLVALVSYTAGGVRTPAFAGFVLPILCAGFLLGHRASFYLLVLTILTGIVLMTGEKSTWLPPLRTYSSSTILFIQSIYLFVSIVMIYLVMRSLQMAMARTRHSEKMLANNNCLLQHEIEERERAELALRASEEQFRQLFQANPHPMYVVDVETRMFLNVNNMMVEKYGYSRDEFLNMNLANLISPKDIPAAEVNAVSFSQQNIDYSRSGPWRQVRKDGTDIFVEVSFHRMNYDGHKAMVCTAYDLTERIRAEEAVRRGEALFSKIFESVPVAIMISSVRERRVLNVNRYFLEMTGYTADEVINHPVSETGVMIPEHQRDTWVKLLGNHDSVRGVEGQWRTKAGAILDILISLESIEVGGEACILGIGVDITERKRMEREQIAGERLRLQLHKEREVLQMKENFVATMSHEFRTPLAIIMSSKESLTHYFDRLTAEGRQEKLHNIEEQTRHIISLLDDVLLLGKAQARKLQFRPTEMDFAVFCQKLFEQIQLTDKAGHAYQFTCQGTFETMQGDEQLLHHILINLLSNAVKYSPPESTVRLELLREGDEAVLRVCDEGIGIPLEDQAHLFEAFYRASNTQKIKGTGLGLAIVKESVLVHGGTITCESVPGEGTIFTVRLPISGIPART